MATAPQLSRREREIMDVLYRLGQATAAEVLTELADPPGYSAIRATLAGSSGDHHSSPRGGCVQPGSARQASPPHSTW